MNKLPGNRSGLAVVLVLLLAAGSGSLAAAADEAGITVAETGVAEAMPDSVELIGTVTGSAELAGDAVEKYRGNKRRALEALTSLKIPGMTVVGSGLAVNSGNPANPMAAFQGVQNDQPKLADKVSVQEKLAIKLAGVDTMSADDLLKAIMRIVDVAKDTGLAIGPGPKGMIEMQINGETPSALATFKLSDPEPLRKKAYAAALKQARGSAEQLAQLAGVRLGEIVSIHETALASKEAKGDDVSGIYAAIFGRATGASTDYSATQLEMIPVRVTLRVRFAIGQK